MNGMQQQHQIFKVDNQFLKALDLRANVSPTSSGNIMDASP